MLFRYCTNKGSLFVAFFKIPLLHFFKIMSLKLDHLQQENKKLRNEIKKLQVALQDINQDISISNSPINIAIVP